ncbi:hypothetical protein [Micromonospora sp. NPDC093277]|uniref:hypothetical protein n=1 Tax=Micromonospora sp. NPDC093277 TaxID=3364291 RepID=UPI003821AD43
MSQSPSSPYPQPQLQPAGYQPPQQPGGYPEAGQPGFGPPAGPQPKKKFSVGKILLIILAVVVVLCMGGGTAIYFARKDTVKEVVDATKTRLVEPETLGGRPKVTEPELLSIADNVKTQLKGSLLGATSSIGGIYGDLAKQDMVMIAGATVLQADPKKNLDAFTRGLVATVGKLEFKTVDAGPLGGEAKCGDGESNSIQVGVCAWADRGSVGMIVIYFKSAADLQPQFAAMRGEIEKKD